MAIFEKGDMWQMWGKTDLFCITTNSTLKTNGELVMGRGIARQTKDKFPDLPLRFGSKITISGGLYGLIVLKIDEEHGVGAFQVKKHYADKAEITLIAEAAISLFQYIITNKPHRVDLNYPGIGNGRLIKADVYPIVSLLPDCVHIWEL